MRRIFNRGSFDKGGRFYGGWWQNCPKKWRARIFIDNVPSVEIDFSGFHIVLLYDREGVAYRKEDKTDPYEVEQLPFLNSAEHARECAKALILVALNAKDEARAFGAFRDKCDTGRIEKTFTNEQLSELLTALKKKHAPIEHYLASDAGIDLMNLDAQIAEHVIKEHTEKEIPVLTLHDSFIVPYGQEHSLTMIMGETLDHKTNTRMRKIKFTGTKPANEKVNRSVRYTRQLRHFQQWLRENNT